VLRVSAVHEATPEIVGALRRLLPQLSSSARPPSSLEVQEIVGSPATTVLVARDDELESQEEAAPYAGDGDAHPHGPVVGMLTLVAFRIPTGVRAWVEDVVVDSRARRRGVGEALVGAAVELAAAHGAHTVDLTSRPSRQDANRLYQRAGFELRETNVYRYRLG
jgi:ribosomal protein S18 acetylase RimI-like enzyme